MVEEKEDKKEEIQEFIKNPWMTATIGLAIVCAILLFLVLKPGVSGNVITGAVIGSDDASVKLVDYLNGLTGGGVTFVGVEDAGAMYEITVSYQGNEIPVFITKDGEYFVSSAQKISDIQNMPSQSQASQQPQNVAKSDKPVVGLFVMTHCPYGTQAEKGMIPVIKALGNKADINVRFVHYFMHGDDEEKETMTQVCIREEQGDKYMDYLACFLEDADSDSCLTKTKINKAKLDSCVNNKAGDYYADDSKLSQQYGVQGSPTLVINGVQVSSGRDSASYLNTICSAFNEAPEECDVVLSSASPSPGFGYDVSVSGGSATDAQC